MRLWPRFRAAPPAPAKPYDHELAARFDAIVEHG
jgi:hypothetical protein